MALAFKHISQGFELNSSISFLLYIILLFERNFNKAGNPICPKRICQSFIILWLFLLEEVERIVFLFKGIIIRTCIVYSPLLLIPLVISLLLSFVYKAIVLLLNIVLIELFASLFSDNRLIPNSGI